MKRLALGVAALLVTAGGSVATAAPSSQADGGDWCEKNAEVGARPAFDRDKPLAAGGGQRKGKVTHAFACYAATVAVADHDVRVSAVVNAWADPTNGALGLSCVPQPGSAVAKRCDFVVLAPTGIGGTRLCEKLEQSRLCRENLGGQ